MPAKLRQNILPKKTVLYALVICVISSVLGEIVAHLYVHAVVLTYMLLDGPLLCDSCCQQNGLSSEMIICGMHHSEA